MEATVEKLLEQKVAKTIEEDIMKLCLPKTMKNPFQEEEEVSSMDYTAVMSLMYTIRGLVRYFRTSTASTRQSFQSALDHATSLEDALLCCSGFVTERDEQIIVEESHILEDVIEFTLSADFLEPAEFDKLRKDVDCFVTTAMKMEENIQESWEQKVAKMIEESIMKICLPKTAKENDEEDGSSSSSMVGLSDKFLEIRDVLTDAENIGFFKYIIIWISGMAGIGKSRLAQKLFHDPSIKASFECRFFVRIGRDYVAYENDKKVKQGDYEELDGTNFWELVTYDRKCLIVLDDVREELSPLYDLCGMIDDSMGSRILVTSRIDTENGEKFKMRFLNEDESWELLRTKVFGEEEDCPRELVEAGKKIAEECEGLPLLIISVAPILLAKANWNPEAWSRIAEKPDSVLKEASHQISEVLLSNYHELYSEDLKLCFLYIAAFPKKYVVWATTIGYLWYVEGFVHSWEYFAGNYLDTLLTNNLVISRPKGYWSEFLNKACSLHCSYWYVCRREAENNKLLYTISSLDDGLDERIKGHRRLVIYTNVLLAIKEVHDSMSSTATVRSLLCTGPYHPYQVSFNCLEHWKLLRVLSALTIRFYEFPVDVVKLVCLKYLGLTCNANLPPSISQLCNLEFLIVHQHSTIKRVGVVTYLPVEIWDFLELEVLHIMGRNLPKPPHQGAFLPKLKKLLDVGIESCSKEVLAGLPRLQKLRVQIVLAPHAAETTLSFFDNLSCLSRLCSFQSVVMNPIISQRHPPPPLSIYMRNLKKLSLSGLGYPWNDINNIARLPRLETLRLKLYAFQGEKWEGEGMSFESLKYLYIEDTDLMQWTARDETFPDLSLLVMTNCYKLKEIPVVFGGYNLSIDLIDCNPSVERCTRQRYSAHNKSCKLTTTYSWKEEKLE